MSEWDEFGLGVKPITNNAVIKRLKIFYEGGKTNNSFHSPLLSSNSRNKFLSLKVLKLGAAGNAN